MDGSHGCLRSRLGPSVWSLQRTGSKTDPFVPTSLFSRDDLCRSCSALQARRDPEVVGHPVFLRSVFRGREVFGPGSCRPTVTLTVTTPTRVERPVTIE